MALLDLLESFPKPKRKVEAGWRTEANKTIAKRYGREFFDGDRVNGYGGYYYDGRWQSIVSKMEKVYGINEHSAVLDIGCGKGFLLYDLQTLLPGIKVAGIDISEYAVNHAMDRYAEYRKRLGMEEDMAKKFEASAKNMVLPHMIIGSAEKLPWADASFDVVLSINTSHNLPREKLKTAIGEMNRVCRPGGHQFIQVDAYRNEEELERMKNWVLTAETMMKTDEWISFFEECGYKGDYFWTTV